MRNSILTIIIICFNFLYLSGQSIQTKSISYNPSRYLNAGLGGGSIFSSNIGINYIHQNKYSFMIASVKGRSSNSRHKIWEITGGKIIKLTKSGKTRLNLKGGIGHLNKRTTHTTYHHKSSIFDGTDLWPLGILNIRKRTVTTYSSSFGLVFRADVELALSKYFGLSISPIVQLFGNDTYTGLNFNIIFGKL